MSEHKDIRTTCSFCEKAATMQCTEECDEKPLWACDNHSYCDPVSCVWRCESCALHYEDVDTEEELNRASQDTPLRRWGPSFWLLVDETAGSACRTRAILGGNDHDWRHEAHAAGRYFRLDDSVTEPTQLET